MEGKATSRDGWRVFAIWIILTAIGEVAVFTWSMLPAGYAEEAEIVDDAFLILLVFAVPVFAFVTAMLLYSAFRYRVRGTGSPTADAPPIAGNKRVVRMWLVATSLLALTVLIWPGFTGLADLRADTSPDLVVEVEAQRWFWTITYPNGGEVSDELVVPVDTRIRFDITSVDILHSFWVPAFRTKMDAVPGRTTELFITADRTGGLDDDFGLRLQCAELCGLGHGTMAIPVEVKEQGEFDAWVDALVAEEAS